MKPDTITDTERFGGAVSYWHGVYFPTGYTVAVIDGLAEAGACVRELVEAGVPTTDVQLVTGDEAIEIHRRQRASAGVLDRSSALCRPTSGASRASIWCRLTRVRTSWCSVRTTRTRRPGPAGSSPGPARGGCDTTGAGAGTTSRSATARHVSAGPSERGCAPV